MNTNSSVEYMDYYLPDTIISVDDIIQAADLNDAQGNISKTLFCANFKNESKLDKIAVFGGQEKLVTPVTNMLNKLFDETKVSASEIHYILCGNELLLNDNSVSMVHYIREKFNLHNAVIIPLLQPCTASLIGMGMSGYLLDQPNKKMIIITANKWPKTCDRWPVVKSRFIDYTVLGDGIGIMLIGKEENGIEIAGWNSISYGNASLDKVNQIKECRSFLDIRMNVIRKGVSFIEDTLKQKGLTTKDLTVIIPPNVNYTVFDTLYSNYLNVGNLFYLENLSYGGHIGDVDLIRNLKDYMKIRSPEGKKHVLLYSIDIEPTFDINYQSILIKLLR
jgi:3-oxoacyl-[acyl-carrier-protein] synthase III